MKDDIDIGLLSTGALVKKGYSFLIANVGKTVALITLAVTALVSFTEISFSAVGTEHFTSTLIMMLIASYIMYFSLEDAGEKLGREGETYREAARKFTALREQIGCKDVAELRSFCLRYRNAELEYRRANMLFSLGYTEEEYKSFLSGAHTDVKTAKAMRRVKNIKVADLSAASLLSADHYTESELKNPKRAHVLSTLQRLVPSTVCMLFTVSVMISVKDNLTVSGVIEALLKLSTLPIIGLKGYSGGYEYTIGAEKAWLETKSSLLEAFLKNKAK